MLFALLHIAHPDLSCTHLDIQDVWRLDSTVMCSQDKEIEILIST
jgi:hypothetical protein